MRGHAYTALFLAEPVCPEAQSMMRSGYETLFSTLSSFRKSVWSYNENESKSVMESLSEGISEAITEGTSHTQAHTFSMGASVGLNSQQSKGIQETFSENRPTKSAVIGQMAVSIAPLLLSAISKVKESYKSLSFGLFQMMSQKSNWMMTQSCMTEKEVQGDSLVSPSGISVI